MNDDVRFRTHDSEWNMLGRLYSVGHTADTSIQLKYSKTYILHHYQSLQLLNTQYGTISSSWLLIQSPELYIINYFTTHLLLSH